MKKLLQFILPVFAILVGVIFILHPGQAHAASFIPSDVIDDSVFNNTASMSAAQIDSWLNSNFPSSCISSNNGFSAPDPTGYSPSGGFTYGANVSAGRVIYDSAAAYGLNPEVLLATLQKEQSLVSGSAGCHPSTPDPSSTFSCDLYGNGTMYNCTSACPYSGGCETIAVGYGCPGNCNSADEGFSKQLIHAAWFFKFGEQRSEGNTSWNVQLTNSPQSGDVWNNSDDPQTCYSGPMTQGTFKRCSTDSSAVSYDGYISIDGTSTHMDTGATAALYWYTPHFSGNQNFDSIFNSWFGSPIFSSTSITMHNISQPDTTPALGQTVTYTASFTNNLSGSITLDSVGIVGRLGDVNTGANRDFGWQGPVTLGAGQTQQFTFTETIRDLGTIYVWPAVSYHGIYVHFNNWGASLTSHIPNLGATITQTTTSPVAGQSDTLSTTIHNYEGQNISLDAAGIPVRFYGQYNYDAAWTSSMTIPASGSSTLISGPIVYDKSGPYTEWVSVKIGNNYVTVSPVTNLTTSPISPSPQNIQLSYTTTPDVTPALGEDVTVAFSLKNAYAVPITLNAVGVVGRYDNPYTGANNDFGWQGPETFTAGQTKTYSFTTNISSLKNFYAWVAINYQGAYVHYNNWGFLMTPHIPSLSLSAPLTVNSPTLGQTSSVTATIKNNESHPIKFSALGIPARYYNTYNYDAVWQSAGTLAASGQSGDSVALSGSIKFDKSGPYTIWPSIYIQGQYITIGSTKTINL